VPHEFGEVIGGEDAVVIQVAEYVRDLKGRFTRGIGLVELEPAMRKEYEKTFVPAMHRIRSALVGGETLDDFSWADIRAALPDVLSDIRVREINGTAKDALDYAENEATGLKVIAIGGDLAFLHDINGLLGADARASRTVCFVVLDNNGGGIFSFLPQAELPTHFETLWGTPHNRDLAAIARAYGANVREVATADGVLPAVEDALAAGGCNVVVVRTDRAKNVERHRQVWDVVADARNGGQ
jgi:hypothetical protein